RVVLALIGLRPQDLRGYNRSPRPASPGSTTKVETVHPPIELCGGYGTFRRTRPYTYNPHQPTGIPVSLGAPGGRAERAIAGPEDNGPCERWRWPKRARRGRPAGSEPVLQPGLPRD